MSRFWIILGYLFVIAGSITNQPTAAIIGAFIVLNEKLDNVKE